MTSFVLTIGGVFLGQSLLAAPAQAVSQMGNFGSVAGNNLGWRNIAGTGTGSGPVLLGATTAGTSATVTVAPVDRTHLYTTSNGNGPIAYLDNTQPPASNTQTAIGWMKNMNGADQVSTIAIDADPYGTRGKTALYAWAWNSSNGISTAENGGTAVPAATTTVLYRWFGGTTDGQFILIPDPNYTGFNRTGGTIYPYWSGGEVIQRTGEIFFGGGECTGINASYAMMIFDPATMDYNFSGTLQPLTQADNIFGTADGCGVTGYVASDFALDANGNAYLLVNSNQAAPSFKLPAASRTWVVRVIPSRVPGGEWKYELVTPLQGAPGQGTNAAAMATGAGTSWGAAFFNGKMYVASRTSPADRLMEINPMSGLVYNTPSTSTANGPAWNILGGGIFDMASGQTAQVLQGTVYNDANANAAKDTGEVGVANVSVALYLKNTAGTYVLQGIRQTNETGNYSFLLGGDGDYIVRVVQPQINGVNAVQTWASGDSPAAINASQVTVTAICASGNVTTATPTKCSGAAPMPFVDPALPTATTALGTDTATQPAAMAIYSTVTIKGDQIVGDANFGITTTGSYGDSSVPPTTVAAGAPVHLNGADPNRLYLGFENGQQYTAPATDNAAHNASDDGLIVQSPLGTIPLQGTILAGTKPYGLAAVVQGTDAHEATIQGNIQVYGWSTAPSGTAWVTTPSWSPVVEWPAGGSYLAHGTFQPVATGTTLGATAQTMSLRAQVSESPTTLPTNATNQYQGTPGTTTQVWATPGEIEDYSFQVADAVYRVAAKTTGGTGTFTIDGKPVTVTTANQWAFGAASAVAAGAAKTVTTTAPAGWDVDSVQLYDTQAGTAVTTDAFSWSTTAGVTTITFTPKVGEDLTVGVTYSMAISATNSTLVMSPLKTATDPQSATAAVNAPITATVTLKAADGTLLGGRTVTFANASDPTTTLTNGAGGKTCVTSSDAGATLGTCAVTITSATAGTYANEVSATVKIGGTDTAVTGSPRTVTFTPGTVAPEKSSWTLAPTADPAQTSMASWVVVGEPTGPGYTATLTLRDADGNLVKDADTAAATTQIQVGTSRTDGSVTISAITNNGDGTYTVKLTSKVADAVIPATTTANVSFGGTPIAVDPAAATKVYALPAPFAPGPPGPCTDPAKASKLSASPLSLGVGSTSTISAYVTDQYCNPVKNGTVVAFTLVPGSSAILTTNNGGATTGGTATASLMDTKAEQATVTAATTTPAYQIPPAAGVTVTFTEGGPDPLTSTFEVAPIVSPTDATHTGWVTVADPGSTDPAYYYVGTVTLVDSKSNLIKTYDPTKIAVIPSSGDVTVSTVVNNGDGTYTVHLSSKVASATTTARATVDATPIGAGTQGTVRPIPFKSDKPGPCTDPAKTPWSLTATPLVLGINELSTATAFITDKFCNAVDAGWDVAFASTLSGKVSATGTGGTATYTAKTDATGKAVVKVTDAVNETVTLTASVPGAPATLVPPAAGVQIRFGYVPVDPNNSTIAVAPPTQVTGADVVVTITVRDKDNNPLDDLVATDFTVTGTSPGLPNATLTTAIQHVGAGQYTVSATSNQPGLFTFAVTARGTTVTAHHPSDQATFIVGRVDPAKSNITVSPTQQTAGVNVTVTVTAHDAQDHAITDLTPDQIVAVGTSAGLPDLQISSFTNMGDGTYRATATSPKVGVFTLSGTADGVALTQHPTVEFVAGGVCIVPNPGVDAAHTTRFARTANDAIADGQGKDTVTAYAFDCNGNAVGNATVVMTDQTTTPGLAGKLTQATASPVKTGTGGAVAVDFTAAAAGEYTVLGEIDGLRPPTAVQLLNFVPGNVSLNNSTMVLDKHTATVGNPVTVTVTTRDAQGSLVGGVSVALGATPAGVTFAGPCVTSNVATSAAYGTCTVPFTAQLATTYSISATIGGAPVGGAGDPAKASPQSVTFTPDKVCYVDCTPINPDHVTHVLVTTTGSLADNMSANAVTAWAYDTFGNAVKNAKVTSTALNSPRLTVRTGTPASPVLTNDLGVATLTYTSDLAVTEQMATVLIQDPAATTPTEPKDPSGPSPVTMVFARGVGDPGQSSVAIAPTTAQEVDKVFTITATVKDATQNAVPGVVVTFAPPAGLVMTDAAGKATTSCTTADGTAGTTAGVCTVTITTTKAGTYDVAATIPVAGAPKPLKNSPVRAVFTAGPICVESDGCTPDPGQPKTRVEMTINGQPGDGTAHNVATVYAYDKHGNPVKDAVVTAAATAGTTGLHVQDTPIAATNKDGESTVWFTADANGTYTAGFTVGTKVPSGSPLAMLFGEGIGSAAHSTFAVTPVTAGQAVPLTVGKDAANQYKVTATVRDTFDVLAEGALVIFAITPAGPVWTGTPPVSSCTTGPDGTCSVTVYSTVSGPYTVTASLNAEAIEQGKPATWKADGVCAADCTPVDPNTPPEKRTRFEVTTNNQVADGNHADVVTVRAFDQWGNAVPGAVITSTAVDAAGGLTIGSTQGTSDKGLAAMTYTSLVAGPHQATLKADGHPVADAASNQAATVTFVAGSADASKSTFVLSATTSPAGTPVIGTVTIYDVNGNLVPGVTVTFTSDRSSTLTPLTTFLAADTKTCTTGDGTPGALPLGKCQVSINDLVREVVAVAATTPVNGMVTPLGGGGDPAKASPQSITFTRACLPGIEPKCTYEDWVPNDHRTRVNVTLDNQTAGVGADQATVWVFDALGNSAFDEVVTTTPVGTVIRSAPVARTSDDGTTVASYTTGPVTTPVTGQAKVYVDGVELVFIPQPGTPANDPVWNVAANSSPVSLHFLDKTAPAAPSITSPTDGYLTNAKPLTITGTGEAGATVTITDNGQPVLDAKGDPVTAVVNGQGTWTLSVPLPDGVHTLKAVQKDPSGNASAPSAPVTVTVDTSTPGKPVVDVANKTEISGTVPVPVSTGTTVDIVGKDGVPICSGVAVNSTTGAWTCATPKDTPSGDITVTAKTTAGNVSDPTVAHLDTVAPGAPKGLSGNDKVITGTVPGPVDACVPGTPEKCTIVVVTYPKGNGSTGTVEGKVNPDGTFSIPTPDDAVDGELSAVTKDPAGNVSGKGTGTLDRIAPEPPVVNPSNGTEISGSGEPNATVTVLDKDGKPVPGCVDVLIASNRHFVCTPVTPLTPGDKVTVVVTDPAGNPSAPTVLTIGKLGIDVANPAPKPGDSQTVTGRNFNPGERVCLTIEAWDGGCRTAGNNGIVVFDFTIPATFGVGTHTVTLTGAKSGPVATTFKVTAIVKTGGTSVPADPPYGLLLSGSVMVLAGLLGTKRWLAKGSMLS